MPSLWLEKRAFEVWKKDPSMFFSVFVFLLEITSHFIESIYIFVSPVKFGFLMKFMKTRISSSQKYTSVVEHKRICTSHTAYLHYLLVPFFVLIWFHSSFFSMLLVKSKLLSLLTGEWLNGAGVVRWEK